MCCALLCFWPVVYAPPGEVILHPVRDVHLHCQNLQTFPSVNSQRLCTYICMNEHTTQKHMCTDKHVPYLMQNNWLYCKRAQKHTQPWYTPKSINILKSSSTNMQPSLINVAFTVYETLVNTYFTVHKQQNDLDHLVATDVYKNFVNCY